MGISDLSGIFQMVKDTLVDKREFINQADTLHHDHGDNMVEIFEVISQAVENKKETSPSSQLDFARELLQQKVNSGTAQVYADGLKQASSKLADQDLSPDTAVNFIQTLLGGQVQEEAKPEVDGLLGSLLSGLSENQGTEASPQEGNLLGTILSGLTGDSTSTDADSNFDMSDVLEIGMDFLQARQSGSSDLEALASAVLSKTVMGQKQHRAASGKIVATSLLDAITKFSK